MRWKFKMPESAIKQGIGAPVRRIDHKKFITKKGRHTYYLGRCNQLFAYFFVSNVAHDVTVKAAE